MRSLAIVFALLSGSLVGCIDEVSGDVGAPGPNGDETELPPETPVPPSDPGCLSPSGGGVSQKKGPGVCIPGTLNQLNAVPTR